MHLKRKIVQINISLILILCASVLSGQQLNTIYIVDSSVNISRSVSCDNFESSFVDIINKIDLKKQKVKKIVNILKSLPKLEKKPFVDVRYKGVVQSKSDTLVFCGDEGSININGDFYEPTPTLNKYLNNLIIRKNK